METNVNLDSASLREKYESQHHELQILFDITSALHCSPHLKDVLQQALMAILQTLRFKMGAIYLVRSPLDDDCFLELAAHHGFSSTLIHLIQSFSVKWETMEKTLANREVRWLAPEDIAFQRLRERLEKEGTREIIGIPLMTQKRVLGFLYVTNNGPVQLRPDRNAFLTTIGHQIGVAIENAQLFDTVERAKSELEISFDAIQHSIFIIDSRHRIHRVNRTSENIYGHADKILGQRYSAVLYNQDTPPLECPINRCITQARPVQDEGPHFRWGGFYHFFAFPVLSLSGVLERVVYYEKDATEAKRLEQRLHQTERLKALGTLAAGIAHEIRNPLATINFNAQMLQRELGLDTAQKLMFEDMLHEVKKIDRIVQQVLHFAKPREPQFCPNSLSDVVKYCLDLARVSMRKATVEVSVHLDESLPQMIMDFNQISQVVMNLLINAIEAMPDGGKLTVTTYQQDDPASLIVQVSDTGAGILAEDKERVFDPFFTRKPEGTGLGLSISRQIMEKHGAFIELETRSAAGATFRLVFPRNGETVHRGTDRK
ncbi:MAG: ATP-binding protein [Syntrophobacteraceae bacterium]